MNDNDESLKVLKMQFQAQDHVSQNPMFLSRSMPLRSVHPFLCLHSQSLQMFGFARHQPTDLFCTLAPCHPPPSTCDHRGSIFNLQLQWRNPLLSRKTLGLLLFFFFFGMLFASTVWCLHTVA